MLYRYDLSIRGEVLHDYYSVCVPRAHALIVHALSLSTIISYDHTFFIPLTTFLLLFLHPTEFILFLCLQSFQTILSSFPDTDPCCVNSGVKQVASTCINHRICKTIHRWNEALYLGMKLRRKTNTRLNIEQRDSTSL